MSQIRVNWGHIFSQYDALLAANLHPQYPVDRHIMLTRIRGWVVHQDYSHIIGEDCLQSFIRAPDGRLLWRFFVPAEQRGPIRLNFEFRLCEGLNAVQLRISRPTGGGSANAIGDESPIQVILRPDIEDRNCHQVTRADAGPEDRWPGMIRPANGGFSFTPTHDRILRLTMPSSSFTLDPSWEYMAPHPFEVQRALDGCSDLYNPGSFSVFLKEGSAATLTAGINGDDERVGEFPAEAEGDAGIPQTVSLVEALEQSMDAYIVKRDDSQTVIAGYPWFLDWGRDTLICLRGIIAAGKSDSARDILRQFALFEENGTLPNMIRGNDNTNRDTSDAPLWFFTACADLVAVEKSHGFLETDCGGRSVREVLLSVANGYVSGTPNGIRMDNATGLIFSPSHFTWMDTNHPAGTPREGYPVEIQALWHAALRFLATLEPAGRWESMAEEVRKSIHRLFTVDGKNYLSDCLHARAGLGAESAEPDDALRSNQLLAITLGAVDDSGLSAGILSACEELLVPGAIRSLADRPVSRPLPIFAEDGTLLNDPANPYQGVYGGDEDTCRKPAYHNGTAWTWPFPSYCEALAMVGGEYAVETALALLSGSCDLMNRGCLGHIPEILDGNAPHTQRGCGAQAWGETELYRVLVMLRKCSEKRNRLCPPNGTVDIGADEKAVAAVAQGTIIDFR